MSNLNNLLLSTGYLLNCYGSVLHTLATEFLKSIKCHMASIISHNNLLIKVGRPT